MASAPPLSEGQQIMLPGGKVLKETGHIQILYGNIAEEGSVAKITGRFDATRQPKILLICIHIFC